MRNQFVKNLGKIISKNSSVILMGFSLASMAGAVIFAIKDTPKALKLIDEKEEELGVEKLPPKEVIKTTWKVYLPTAASMVISAACAIGSNSIHAKKYAALSTAYALAERSYKTFKDATEETITEEQKEELDRKIARKYLAEAPKPKAITESEKVSYPKGQDLYFDKFSGRYFNSSRLEIEGIENRLGAYMLDNMFLSLNDYYDEVGLRHVKYGDDIGWHIQDGVIKFKLTSDIAEDGRPCIVVDTWRDPKIDRFF